MNEGPVVTATQAAETSGYNRDHLRRLIRIVPILVILLSLPLLPTEPKDAKLLLQDSTALQPANYLPLVMRNGPHDPAPNTSCLLQPGPLITIQGDQVERFNRRWDPVAENTKIDARDATWTAQWPVQDQFNYPVRFAGGPNVCFSGGSIQGNYPEQIGPDAHSTWEYMHSNAAIVVYAENSEIEGVRIHNYGDGIDFSYGPSANFVVKGVHLSYIRDDCVENDWLYGGLIDDVLFDGCYSAFSARTYSGQDPPAEDGSNNIWTIQNSLIRLQPMWGVYQNRDLIPGHDGWFKWDSSGISPGLALHNNIFRVDQDANNTGLGVPSGKLESCSNNTVVWLGSGPYPDPLPTTFNDQPCFTITTDPSVWDDAVKDWLSRHQLPKTAAPLALFLGRQPGFD